MIRWLIQFSSFFIIALGTAAPAPVRFEMVSDHVYFLPSVLGGYNVGAVVTKEGVVLIDPPPEAELTAAMEALEHVTSSRVRWVICTSYHRIDHEVLLHFHRLGAAFISHESLDALALKSASASSESTDSGEPNESNQQPNDLPLDVLPTPRFNFGRQMRLFPEGIEVRILALEHKAHTGGDIVVLIPDEKVLLMGDLYVPGRFPQIDSEPGEGSALGWIDGIRQVIRWVPLLKSAKPEPEPDPEEPPEEEKTLEELVTVVPGRGSISNLQDVKDLYDLARSLRTAADRAVKAGRSLKSFLLQGSLNEHRELEGFESYAAELFNALAGK